MPGMSRSLRYVPGGAWAARRSLLDRHGFYDTAVLGGGDKLMFSAAAGRYDPIGKWMCPAHQKHFSHWAGPFAQSVDGRISYVEGDLVHLWHGDVCSRRYYERIVGFEDFQFDPAEDLALTPEGVWRWNSQKADMHAFVREQLSLLLPQRAAVAAPCGQTKEASVLPGDASPIRCM